MENNIIEPEFAAKEEENKEEEKKEEKVCPECGKPLSECTCDKTKHSVETCSKCGKPMTECTCKEDDKKKDYVLEEVVEYAELQNQYNELQAQYNLLNDEKTALSNEVAELRTFKANVEKAKKQEMIDSFTMLSDEDKLDVVENIDKYSLDEIESKLCVICVHNRVSFSNDSDDDKKEISAPTTTFNLDSAVETDDSTVPAWIKVLQRVATENN